MKLPTQYEWLSKEGSPLILVEALRLYGTKEIVGSKHNPKILLWAQEIGGWVASYYKADEIAWCGLFVGICAKRANFPFSQSMLSAKAWLKWGSVESEAMFGDVLVFNRNGGGHVGFYVGEDKLCYHVLGGNQGDEVSIVRIKKDRLLGIRRCKWRISQPANVRKIVLSSKGSISSNEA
jgi:uncharacterized protein (TIGR02594 family)